MQYALASIMNLQFGYQRKINDNAVHFEVSGSIFFISRTSLNQAPVFAFYFFKMLKNHIALSKKAGNLGARCHLMGQTLHKMDKTTSSRKLQPMLKPAGKLCLSKTKKAGTGTEIPVSA